MCKVSDESEMVGGIIGWFDMKLPEGTLGRKSVKSHCLSKAKKMQAPSESKNYTSMTLCLFVHDGQNMRICFPT